MVQRKYRTPRVGAYLNGTDSYGFGVPVLPVSDTRKMELALEELRWLRRMRMGTRKNFSFADSQTTWWATYGATHPEYFAELLPGRTHPHPATDRVKLHVSGPTVWQRLVDNWVAAGAGSNLNISPNDSRSFCVCSSCLAWDRPSRPASVVFESSEALLGDRYARHYTEVANLVNLINPNATVYAYAYDVYRNAPFEATVPANVALVDKMILTTASDADTSDSDQDGSSDLAEFIGGSAPGDANSVLKVENITTGAHGDVTIRWQGVAGKTYTLETSAALRGDWAPIAIGIPGSAPLTTYTFRFNSPRGFMRVLVE